MANKTVYPYGTGGQLPSSIGIIDDLTTGGADKALSAGMGKELNEKIVSLLEEAIDVAQYTAVRAWITDGNNWRTTADAYPWYSIFILLPKEVKKIAIKANALQTSTYALLQHGQYSHGTAVAYATGCTKTEVAAGEMTEITNIPANANVLWIGTLTTEDVTPQSLNFAYDNVAENDIGDKKMGALGYWTRQSSIDSVESSPTFGQAITTTNNYAYSDYIDCEGFAKMRINCIFPNNSNSTYAKSGLVFYDAEKNPIKGYNFPQSTAGNGYKTLYIPLNAKYFRTTFWWESVTTQGGVEMMRYTANEVASMLNPEECPQFAKVRVCAYNIGQFSLGASASSTITSETREVMQKKWREALNEISADLLLLSEYQSKFVTSPEVLAQEAVFCQYPFYAIGSRYSYTCEATFSKLLLQNIREVDYTNYVQHRYYQVSDIYISGKLVKLVATHLDWDQDNIGATYRAEQIQKLIDDFSDYEHVIICGDFNVTSSDEFDPFLTAGFTMANHDYLGDIPTYPAGQNPSAMLDNIIVKGFAMDNIGILNDDTLSDHAALYCDLSII